MRIYERYFARQIYLTFLFVLFAFSGLFFFFDLISELDAVGKGSYGFGFAVIRVALLTPSRFYEIIPVAALISAIYVFATMAANSEFTIFRVSGLSTGRALGSLMKIGIPMLFVTYLIGEVVGPYADQLSERVRLEALGSSVSSNFESGVWVKDTLTNDGEGRPVTRFVNVGELLPDTTITKVRIYEFDSQFRLSDVRTAERGRFRGPDHWALDDVTETKFQNVVPNPSDPKDALNPVYRSTLIHLPHYLMRSQLTPQILSVLLVSPDRMSIVNLYSYIQHLQENHQDTQRYEVALWNKLLYPFAILVMLVLSLPFAYLHTRAGVVGIKVFGGIMLGMSFQLVNTLFSHVGTLNTWPPVATAAVPSLLYLVVGLIGLLWVNRN
ncbi:LPS export ABC transporter permease LptG [Pararobbsia alpina]|uniref:Lipopolysaccharide export system permease protein LptG n=1 Tax=Pararobbsia alpina TaxID=621374 RepID=A0A6S7AUW2_9BURK|nr:LPS export ABC transporter permease LptG [Pararobbsia alpina]CAB3776354.1 Lipopolysaccharide export system permease protein LptG [Pararobbsia alpina]